MHERTGTGLSDCFMLPAHFDDVTRDLSDNNVEKMVNQLVIL